MLDTKPSPEMANQLFMTAAGLASQAATQWLAKAVEAGPKYAVKDGSRTIGQLLDLCGNANVRFRKKNSKWYNAFKKAGLVRHTDSGCVDIPWAHYYRQEYGLQMAAADAAVEFLRKHGVDVYNWNYID